MVNNNIDVRKAASELYHRLVETKEITNNDAKAAVGVLSVIQKSFMIDIMKQRSNIELLDSEESKEKGKMFVKKIS
jgi:hypothetical protein